MSIHRPDCHMNPQIWFRHAAAAAGALTMDPPSDLVDRDAAVALTDALAYFVELGDLTVTLQDVIDHALIMDPVAEADMCSCGAADS